MSVEDIFIRPLVDAPNEKFQAWKYLDDFDGGSSTESDPESWHMLEELRTKICMDFDTDNTSHSMMKNQLHQLIKAVIDTSNAVAQAMHMSS